MKTIFFQFMRKGFIPPAPVGNAPSQIVNCDGGTQTKCSCNKKKDNLVKHPSHSSSSSSTSSTFNLLSLKVQFLIDN